MTTPTESSADALRARDALTALILDVFRLNGDLLAAGDALVEGLGLTSARWQVLGAVALSPVPLPVAHVARNMGLSRQAVQRVVDDMRAEGLVRIEPNPHHRRAVLVFMTDEGRAAFAAATRRQKAWALRLSSNLRPDDIEATSLLLRTLQSRLAEAAENRPELVPAEEM